MKNSYFWFRKNWPGLLVKLYAIFIIFATTAPFKIARDTHTILENLRDAQWLPFFVESRHFSRGDFLANIVFFIPFGILLAQRRILRFYRRFTGRDWAEILLKGVLISFFVEFLQLFTYDRSTSVNDLLSNTLGTGLGAFLMYVLYRRYHVEIKTGLDKLFFRKPDMIIFAILCGFIVLAEFAPFNFWISAKSVRRSLILLRANPFLFKGISGEFLQLSFYYGIAGYFGVRALYRYFPEIRRPKLTVVGSLALLAVLIELVQLTLVGRRHSVLDPLISLFGAGLGALLFSIQFQRRVVKPGNSGPDGENIEIWEKMDHQVFMVTGILYIFLLIRFMLATEAGVWAWGNFGANIIKFFEPYRWLLNTNRLGVLEDLIKYLFMFLPLGFFGNYLKLQFRGSKQNRWATISMWGLAFIFFGIQLGFSTGEVHWSKFFVSLLGIWLGGELYFFYNFIQSGKSGVSDD